MTCCSRWAWAMTSFSHSCPCPTPMSTRPVSFFPISIGAQIYYAESVDKLTDNMAEVRPTLMMAVPRLYEVMHQRIMQNDGQDAAASPPPVRNRAAAGAQTL